MKFDEGSEFVGGFLKNQVPAQPLDVFDQILQEVERTGVKASRTTLYVTTEATMLMPWDKRQCLVAHFKQTYMRDVKGIAFLFRPAR
jgi:hypothetical protein